MACSEVRSAWSRRKTSSSAPSARPTASGPRGCATARSPSSSSRLPSGRGAHRRRRRLPQGGRRRRGHRRGRRALDRDPRLAAAGGRGREAHPHGGAPAPARHRPGRGGRRGLQRAAPLTRRAPGPGPPDRHVPLPRPDRRRQDRAGPRAGRVHVRQRSDAMVRIDMSEYMEKHAVSRLVGAPPGYVGYEEGGQLTEAVRRRPYTVVLLDEIEKAHPDVFNVLLQVMDDGRLTDGQGRTVDFKNTVLIMTSNIARAVGRRRGALQARVHQPPGRHRRVPRAGPRAARRDRRPAGRARADRACASAASTSSSPTAARTLLGDLGYDPTYGARPLKRVIQKRLVDQLALAILEGELPRGRRGAVDAVDGELRSRRRTPASADAEPAAASGGAGSTGLLRARRALARLGGARGLQAARPQSRTGTCCPSRLVKDLAVSNCRLPVAALGRANGKRRRLAVVRCGRTGRSPCPSRIVCWSLPSGRDVVDIDVAGSASASAEAGDREAHAQLLGVARCGREVAFRRVTVNLELAARRVGGDRDGERTLATRRRSASAGRTCPRHRAAGVDRARAAGQRRAVEQHGVRPPGRKAVARDRDVGLVGLQVAGAIGLHGGAVGSGRDEQRGRGWTRPRRRRMDGSGAHRW